MGLLDDLRQQSSSIKAEEQKEVDRRARAEGIYRTQIQPKLHKLYSTLNELINHLNYIKPDIRHSYPMNADGLQTKMIQQDYIARIDSSTETKLVTFMCQCVNNRDIEYSVNDPKFIEPHIQFFKKHNLQYQCQDFKNTNYEVTGARFKVKAVVPIRFSFEADIDNACIKLTCTNFCSLGIRIRSYKPEQLTEQFFDNLCRYIIRENADFLEEKVAEEVRERLRNQIAAEQQERQDELKEAEKLQAAEKEKLREERSGRFQLLKKIKFS